MYLSVANKCSFCLKSASTVTRSRFYPVFTVFITFFILFLSLYLTICLWLFFNKIIFVSPLAASFLSNGEPARTVRLRLKIVNTDWHVIRALVNMADSVTRGFNNMGHGR